MNQIFAVSSFLALAAAIQVPVHGQTIEMLETGRVDDRFFVDAICPADSVLVLRRYVDEAFSVTEAVGMSISRAGIVKRVGESQANTDPVGLFRVSSFDLPTYEADTDGDGIIDRVELQSAGFLDPVIPTDAGNADVFTVSPDVAVSSVLPGSGSGSIESSHAVDLYRFQATAGDAFFFDVISYQNPLNLHLYQLVDPYGNIVASRKFGLSDLGPLTLSHTGEYVLVIGDSTRPGSGNYEFGITEIPAPQTFSISIGDTVANGVPAAGAGNIESPGAFDRYLFTASMGDRVFFNVLSYLGTGTIPYRVINPEGVLLGERNMNLGDIGTIEILQSGTHILEVGRINNASTGTYSIALTSIPEPETFSIVIGDTVSNGVPSAGAGNIETQGAYDRYTFAGTAGEKVYLTVPSFSGAGTIQFRLLDPTGAILDSSTINLGNRGTITLPLTGEYVIEVGEPADDSIGTYSISLTSVPAPQFFELSIGDPLSNGIPSAGAGNIEARGALDVYTFEGTAGQNIYIHVPAYSGTGTIQFRLYDPSDELMESANLNLGNLGTLTLPATGTYRLEVGEPNDASTGTYSISITNVPAPLIFPIAIGDTISNGVPSAGAGNIEAPGTFDHYTFSATAGQRLFIRRVSFTSSLGSVQYQLLDPAEEEIAIANFNLNMIGIVEIATTGIHTLRVGRANQSATGIYSIAITEVPNPESFPIAIGDTVSNGVPSSGAGNLEAPGARDLYTFTADPGDVVNIDLLGQSGVFSIGYRLLDSNGTVVASKTSFADTNHVVLTLGGTYTLDFGADQTTNPATGTYSLRIVHSP